VEQALSGHLLIILIGTEGTEMNTQMYKAMCRYKDEPGAGFGWVYVQATNPFEAYQFLKAQYGRLLLTEYAVPA
jgi:hypothetical protein